MSKGNSNSNDERIGSMLRQYRLDRLLGRGGMGEVWAAWDTELQRPVALKRILGDGEDLNAQARFEREAQSLAGISHPNVVKVYQFGQHQGLRFMAMELIEGKSLAERIEELANEPFQSRWSELSQKIQDVCAALEACHEQGLTHRDLKPANIVIENGSGRAVLIDFGIVRRAVYENQSDDSLTRTQEILGTPDSMAPEQIEREHEKIGPATDVWALGVLIYQAATAVKPFRASSLLQLYREITDSHYSPCSDINPEIPPLFNELFARCFQQEPGARPSVATVRSLLSRASDSRTRSYTGLILALILATMAAIGLGTFFLVDRRPELTLRLRDPDEVIYSRGPMLRIVGIVSPPGATVQVGEQRTNTDREGRFSLDLRAPTDVDSLIIEVRDSERRLQRTVKIRVEPGAALYEITGTVEKFGMTILEARGGQLSGRFHDPRGRLSIGGAPIEASRFKQFDLDLDSSRLIDRLLVDFEDRHGNKGAKELVVVPDSLLRSAHAALTSVKSWAATPEPWQDLLILAIVEAMPGFEALETKTYKCGGQAHRIGRVRHKRTGLVLHLIPGGAFTMGRLAKDSPYPRYELGPRPDINDAAWDIHSLACPPHEVLIRRPFFMGATEVSRLAWSLGSELESPKEPQTALSWVKVQSWLTTIGDGLRLPSEAEWEFACRAGTTSPYFWGPDFDPKWICGGKGLQHVYYDENRIKRPRPLFREVDPESEFANAFGLSDMLGNVWEFCEDDFFVGYHDGPYTEDPRKSRDAANFVASVNAVIRGEWSGSDSGTATSAERMRVVKKDSPFGVGFRVARSLPAPGP